MKKRSEGTGHHSPRPCTRTQHKYLACARLRLVALVSLLGDLYIELDLDGELVMLHTLPELPKKPNFDATPFNTAPKLTSICLVLQNLSPTLRSTTKRYENLSVLRSATKGSFLLRGTTQGYKRYKRYKNYFGRYQILREESGFADVGDRSFRLLDAVEAPNSTGAVRF
ncbi:hypothetical protein C8R43DRAFT_955359 [Mycena crocata]|nr:hypothetical protein C8R43DRAFT_955359 [Mycena crocata]